MNVLSKAMTRVSILKVLRVKKTRNALRNSRHGFREENDCNGVEYIRARIMR